MMPEKNSPAWKLAYVKARLGEYKRKTDDSIWIIRATGKTKNFQYAIEWQDKDSFEYGFTRMNGKKSHLVRTCGLDYAYKQISEDLGNYTFTDFENADNVLPVPAIPDQIKRFLHWIETP